MFKRSPVLRYAWPRARSSNGVRFGQSKLNGNSIQNQQVLNAINQHMIDNRPGPLRTFLQVTAVIFGTIAGFSVYQVAYRGEETFVPLYISKSKRSPRSSDDLDEKMIKMATEEQLLERLSLNDKIQKEFRLPIKLSESEDFEIWIEERDTSIKGIQISPKRPFFKRDDRPINIPKYDTVLEPIGGNDRFNIHKVNQDERDYDVWFLGTVKLMGKSGEVCDVVFKGIFDFEHVKQAQLRQVHLIRIVKGKKEREVLW